MEKFQKKKIRLMNRWSHQKRQISPTEVLACPEIFNTQLVITHRTLNTAGLT